MRFDSQAAAATTTTSPTTASTRRTSLTRHSKPMYGWQFHLEAIQEFRIDSALATAEGGGTGGGQLAVTSTSGTNAFHGNAFEFLRNNVFDARQPIDNLNPVQPPFRLNQFGGNFRWSNY